MKNIGDEHIAFFTHLYKKNMMNNFIEWKTCQKKRKTQKIFFN